MLCNYFRKHSKTFQRKNKHIQETHMKTHRQKIHSFYDTMLLKGKKSNMFFFNPQTFIFCKHAKVWLA